MPYRTMGNVSSSLSVRNLAIVSLLMVYRVYPTMAAVDTMRMITPRNARRLVGDSFMRVVKHRHLGVELRISPQHMTQNTQAGVAEFLGGVHKIPHRGMVCTNYNGREAYT